MISIPPHSNYKPLEPSELYLTAEEWRDALDARANARFSPFGAPERRRTPSIAARGRAATSRPSATSRTSTSSRRRPIM